MVECPISDCYYYFWCERPSPPGANIMHLLRIDPMTNKDAIYWRFKQRNFMIYMKICYLDLMWYPYDRQARHVVVIFLLFLFSDRFACLDSRRTTEGLYTDSGLLLCTLTVLGRIASKLIRIRWRISHIYIYIHIYIWDSELSSLAQKMACRLIGVEPLSEPGMTYYLLDDAHFSKIYIKMRKFSHEITFTNMFANCRHFVTPLCLCSLSKGTGRWLELPLHGIFHNLM